MDATAVYWYKEDVNNPDHIAWNYKMISELQIGKNAERGSHGHIWNTKPKSDQTDNGITTDFSGGSSPLGPDLNLGPFHVISCVER